jgi:predicted RNA-binding Zn-ribbon protein involved in translation (DUF1610 family)
MPNRKMICPECGDEMNHHADKLVYPADHGGTRQNHADLGGVLEETHACPGCGGVESRRAEQVRLIFGAS